MSMDTINILEACCPKQQVEEPVQEQAEQETESEFLSNKETRAEERMAICRECPELRALNNCRQCGCFMNIKTRIYSASCPLGKW